MTYQIEITDCPKCDAHPGKHHISGCDVARCADCGGQWFSCDCEYNTKQVIWSGRWPGVLECEEFNLFTSSDSIWGYSPDLNTLYASSDYAWSKSLARWVRA